MPELPEVETVRRQLQPLIAGRKIVGFQVLPGAERLLRGRSGSEVDSQLQGSIFTTVQRRGKYLGLNLEDGQVVVVHLRMTGSLRFRPRGYEDEPFTRAVFNLDHNDQLRFVDVRKFGTIDLVDRMEEALPELGPEPLSDDFTIDAMWHALRGRQQPIKAALLDQRNIAGIGNIYADEALFLSRLNPEAPAGSLRPPNAARSTPPSSKHCKTESPTVAHHSATTPTSTAPRESSSTSCESSAAPTNHATSAKRPSAESSSEAEPPTSAQGVSRSDSARER